MQVEGSLSGSSSPCGALPLLVDLSDGLASQSLCRARMYVNFLTNLPPQPHPFGIFLEEASRLKTASAAGEEGGRMTTSSSLNDPMMTSETSEEKKGKAASNEDDVTPSLLDALRQKHGYSSGSALYRMWVQQTQDYLSMMAQRIADAVLTHAIPLVVDEKQKDPQSSHLASNGHKENKKMGVISEESPQYDIHVRFLPSPAPRAVIDPSLAQAFCAEIIVRDVAALRRRELAASLLRARYTAVAAEGQTVQSALAFWRAVQMDAAVEEEEEEEDGNKREDKGEEYNEDGGGEGEGEGENTMALGISTSSAVVLGRCSEKTATVQQLPAGPYGEGSKDTDGIDAEGNEEKCAWVQPQIKQARRFHHTHPSPLHGMSQKRHRVTINDTTTSTTEITKAPLQSTAGLMAVFYLATNGVLYTGTVCGLQKRGTQVQKPHQSETSTVEKKTDNKKCSVDEKQVEETPVTRDAKSVFFLPCASSSSFLRGLLGL
ncbi:uncharacterized protein TM35_000091560 [Trypanosoma theileri]|uniref:Uncharacterized protein n=1 Tax=Trypanosoma theileri TaxID=67003 RepID=A0A1X0NZG5_9TRYP|nr:uncharacterized protein TM35_000091560 [Trypanosoma theileri]ORC90106.1 hypothetical protein TM35_000091560 [Trypanosoma theileri]